MKETIEHIQSISQNAVQLHSQAEVETAIDGMAHAVTERLADTNPVMMCVMVVLSMIAVWIHITKIELVLETSS